jgi:NAD(P)-dependent dehydrogenase (short-subunit alcohol dehydrogenase family)
MKLAGQTAIVTGAGGGTGRQTALRLAREGAAVVIADVNIEKANVTAEEVRALGAEALVFQTDVRSSQDVNQMVQLTLEKFGRIDILVNCAGGSASLIGKLSLFEHSDEEAWDFVLGINLKGVLICTRAVIDHMIANRRGKIVNVSSIAGVVGIMERVDYSAAKGGVIALTQALAMEIGHYGINVNCVSPGMVARVPGQAKPNSGTYLGRNGKPEEIANLIAFLASDEADYITGQNYIIDGGRWLGPKS